MRRMLSLVIAVIATVLITAGPLGISRVFSAPTEPDQGGRRESPCSPLYEKHASPEMLLLGERVQIRMTFGAVCAGEQLPVHIVLVLDASGSMAGGPSNDMKAAAREMIQQLDMREHPNVEVGVVEFNNRAQTICPLTNSAGRVIGCINRVGAQGGTRIDLGITEGMKVLIQGRQDVVDSESVEEIMVVLSDGANGNGCPPVQRAANGAKGRDVLVVTICVGACDVQCMRDAATSPRYFFHAENTRALGQIFRDLADVALRIYLQEVVIDDILPSNMHYVEGSAAPEADWRQAENRLTWSMRRVPADGITVSYVLEPLEEGTWPTSVESRAAYVDNSNRSGARLYDVPNITVLQPANQGTPEQPRTPPTLTPTPSSTEPLPPTATPTRAPEPIYLPILLRQECVPNEEHADIVLVLDMSTSMARTTRAGRPKVEAVLEAAETFAASVDLSPNEDGDHSQLAVVGFNADAWIEVGLTRNLSEITAALQRLPDGLDQHTRLDRAIEIGTSAALDPATRKPANVPVMILLTDGLPNRVPPAEDGRVETTILRLAAAAKSQGITIHTIGVGDPDAPDINERINPDLLRLIATGPGFYHQAPDAEEVQNIYADLKVVDECAGVSGGW